VAKVWTAPDAAAALDEWACHLARYHARIIPVVRAAQAVPSGDPDAVRHRARVVRAQLASCRRLAEWLEREGRLAPSWTVTTATDMMWALISTDMIEGCSPAAGRTSSSVSGSGCSCGRRSSATRVAEIGQ
jgi:hypothetical protein